MDNIPCTKLLKSLAVNDFHKVSLLTEKTRSAQPDACLTWSPEFNRIDTVDIDAAYSPYRRLPLIFKRESPDMQSALYRTENHQQTIRQADSLICAGQLTGLARDSFCKQASINREKGLTTIWFKESPGDRTLRVPVSMQRFIPVLSAFASIVALNIPKQNFDILWPYIRLRAGIDTRNHKQGQPIRLGKQPHQDYAASLSENRLKTPRFTKFQAIIFDSAPTIYGRDIQLNDQNRPIALVDPISAAPCTLLLSSNNTWHQAGITQEIPDMKMRNFVVMTADFDEKAIANDYTQSPALVQALDTLSAANDQRQTIIVPAMLSQKHLVVNRHTPSDIYNYGATQKVRLPAIRPT